MYCPVLDAVCDMARTRHMTDNTARHHQQMHTLSDALFEILFRCLRSRDRTHYSQPYLDKYI